MFNSFYLFIFKGLCSCPCFNMSWASQPCKPCHLSKEKGNFGYSGGNVSKLALQGLLCGPVAASAVWSCIGCGNRQRGCVRPPCCLWRCVLYSSKWGCYLRGLAWRSIARPGHMLCSVRGLKQPPPLYWYCWPLPCVLRGCWRWASAPAAAVGDPVGMLSPLSINTSGASAAVSRAWTIKHEH